MIDAIAQFRANTFNKPQFLTDNQLDQRPIMALLPGSRKQEIGIKLPLMLEAAQKYMGSHQIVIAGAPNQSESYYRSLCGQIPVKIVFGLTYDLLSTASVALVTSGTATLETALFGVPQVVCYKGAPISYHIAKRLIKVPYISLVNLILNRELVTELIQHECNPMRMQEELDKIINGPQVQIIKDGYLELENLLGGGGASERTAQHMLKSIAKR